MTGSDRERDVVALAHDHSGPDWRCPACAELAVVLRDRMRWASMHWGNLHDDAWPSLARAVLDSDWLAEHEKAIADEAAAEALDQRNEALDRLSERTRAKWEAEDRYAALVDKVRALADEWFDEDAGIEHVAACQDFGCKTCVVIACGADLRALLEADQ